MRCHNTPPSRVRLTIGCQVNRRVMVRVKYLSPFFIQSEVAWWRTFGNRWHHGPVTGHCFRRDLKQGCAGGLLGRDPFSISGLSSGTLFVSLLGMPHHSPLSSQNWKPTSSLLPIDFSLSFFCFHQTHDHYACVFAVCVCVCVCVCRGVCGCVRVWVWHAYLLCKRPGLSWDGAQ